MKKEYVVEIINFGEEKSKDFTFQSLEEALEFANDYINKDDKEIIVTEMDYTDDNTSLIKIKTLLHKKIKINNNIDNINLPKAPHTTQKAVLEFDMSDGEAKDKLISMLNATNYELALWDTYTMLRNKVKYEDLSEKAYEVAEEIYDDFYEILDNYDIKNKILEG